MRFDLVDLRLFLRVAEAGSITRGAERAHLALASASERIRGLEEAVGVVLLERGRRGVALTAAGRALAHHARVVLQQVERMEGELGLYADGLRGHVRLLANTAALSEFLPEALAAFLAAHPRIDIDLEERSSWAIVQAIAAGEAEIGLVADSVDLGALEVVPFRPDRLVLVTPRGHALGERRRIAFAETLDQPFVGLGEDSALQAHLAGHAARLGRRPAHRVRLRSFEAVCRMVEQGVGVAIVPEAAARRAARSMRIRRVQLADPWAARRLMIAVRRLDELTAAARLLVETLRATDAPSS
jgi:DNA-binding transcriptional LysR family regulator